LKKKSIEFEKILLNCENILINCVYTAFLKKQNRTKQKSVLRGFVVFIYFFQFPY